MAIGDAAEAAPFQSAELDKSFTTSRHTCWATVIRCYATILRFSLYVKFRTEYAVLAVSGSGPDSTKGIHDNNANDSKNNFRADFRNNARGKNDGENAGERSRD